MKKKLAMILACATLLSLSACGTPKSGEEGGGITKISWYLPIEKPEDVDMVLEKVNEITEEKIGVDVDLRYITTGGFTQKMSLMMSSREEFDLTFTGWANPYIEGAKLDGYVDITDMLDDYPDLKNSMPDYMWEASRVDGKIYAVPNYQAVGLRTVVYLRKDLVDKYKFDYEACKTIFDLEPYFDTILANEKGVYPIQPEFSANVFLDDPYEYENTSVENVFYNKKSDEIVFKAYDDDYVEACKKMRQWFEKGYIRNDIATGTTNSDVKNGLYAAILSSADRPGDREDRELANGFEFYTVPITNEYHMNASSVYSTMTAVSSTSKHPEKALELLQLVNTDSELMNLLSYGIEGVHYEKIGENKIKKVEKSGYSTSAAWMFGNMFMSYNTQNHADDLWEQIEAANDSAIRDKYLSFKADTTPISATLANIGSIASEYTGFQNGSTNINELGDEAKERYLEAGSEELVEETKRQIEEFEKSNK